jgi:hypothetical protein
MTRRNFISAQAWTAAVFCGGGVVSGSEKPAAASVAITMDDFNIRQAWPDTAADVNRQLLNLFDNTA